MGKKVAIIGAGYTGMSAAKRLLENGCEVNIYEKDTSAGGMVRTVRIGGESIEEYYRHIFKSDKYVVDLVKELGLEQELKWLKAKMGYYINNKPFRFGQPLTLLTFNPLTFMEKIRFRIRRIKNKSN